ncbi:transposase [Georgenia thermotolerans]|uniref:IS5/IS1182 family transposase n=1 Tax=Georgenia thermotolerans TaxID=527326 RepID=A0A7J5UJH3_9MICO|nr:transposase [Georgenia thermotolerans]KAE8762466.1 IS5/IS1182 family transposase [Georgenia thermotolerans]
MQGRSRDQRDLFDAESMAGELLEPGSVFAFLAEHRLALFPEGVFADLFRSVRGRPSVPADVIAAVLVLQALHGFSDREATEAVTFDLRWKAACGLGVQAPAFHPTTLTYWRRRLAKSERPNRIFEAITAVVMETGVLRGKNRRALDSTVLEDAVATQDTVTQLIAAIRRVAREVTGGKEAVAEHCTRHDYSSPGKPRIAWDDPAARDELVSALVTDALALLDHLNADALEGDEAQVVALLAVVAGQDVEPAEGSDGTDGRWRIARQVAYDRVISTVGPETRHAHKTVAQRRNGFKAHVVVEPTTGLVTATKLTKAAGPESADGTVGTDLLATDTTLMPAPTEHPEHAGGAAGAAEAEDAPTAATGEKVPTRQVPVEVLADSAYGTGEALAALQAAGHTAIIKPWPLRPAVPGGFTVEDFTVDETAGTVTCPNGLTRTISPKRKVTFGAGCRGCPLWDRCTTSARGRKLDLHPHDGLQRAHRARAQQPGFQQTYRSLRPMVERSIAWLTRGNRKVRYRGITKNDHWLHRRAAAINLKRLLALGLHRTGGTWVMATA